MYKLDNKLLQDGLETLEGKLPSGWSVKNVSSNSKIPTADAFAKITAPDSHSSRFAIELKRNLQPQGVLALKARFTELKMNEPMLVISNFLSVTTQERLREANLGYIDLTGNIWFTIENPGLYIETTGADQNPNKKERPARSLRGSKAGRVVRALIDFSKPTTVREIAARAEVDAGYVSRVLTFLEQEALVTRRKNEIQELQNTKEKTNARTGKLESVEWARLLNRWSLDAPFESRGKILTCIDPRGLEAFLERLAKSKLRYAVTGSLAASQFAQIAPARLGAVYVENLQDAIKQFGIKPSESGANIMLIEPDDDGVFINSKERKGIQYAALGQVAADLLTGPGRAPAEAKELIAWMSENEETWRG